MPGSRVQASPGGNCPRTSNSNTNCNLQQFKDRDRDRSAKERQSANEGMPEGASWKDLRQGGKEQKMMPNDGGSGGTNQDYLRDVEEGKEDAEDGMPGGANLEELKQRGEKSPEDGGSGGTNQDLLMEDGSRMELVGTWVKDAQEDDNDRYVRLMQYMEEKREEARMKLQEDEQRKADAKRKEERWAMLRESVRILRENTDKWRIRRIDECERIKEEEKKDRLALVQVKKRKYGIKKVSKEESSRLKMRTEERLEVARAKENLWRRYQDESRNDMDVEEEEMWQRVLESILELEEKEGKWKEPRKEIEKIQKRMMYKEGEGRGHEGDTRNDKMGRVKADQMHEVVVDGSDDERMPGEVVDGGGERMKMQEGRVNGRDDENTRMPEDVMGGGDCNDDEAKNEILEMHESVVGGSGDDKRVAGDVVGDGDDNDRDDMEGTQDDAYEADERMRMHENVVGGGTDDSGIPGDAVRGGDGSDGAGVNDDREEGGMIMKCGERGGGHLLLVQGGQAQVRVGEEEGDDIARDRECDGGTGLYGSKRRHSGTFNLRNKTNTDDTISVRGLVEKWEFLGRKTGTSAPVPELEPAKFVFGQSNMGESPLKRRRMGTEDDQGHPVLGPPLARLQRLTGV